MYIWSTTHLRHFFRSHMSSKSTLKIKAFWLLKQDQRHSLISRPISRGPKTIVSSWHCHPGSFCMSKKFLRIFLESFRPGWSAKFTNGLEWFRNGFSWFQVGFHGFSGFQVGFSWFQIGFRGFSWFQVGFSRLGCFFVVQGQFSWFFKVPGWF